MKRNTARMAGLCGRFAATLCALSLALSGRAQAIEDTGDIIQRIDSRMQQLDSLIFSVLATVAEPDFLEWRIEMQPDTAYADAVASLTDSRLHALKGQTGVQVTGQTYYRPDSQLGLTDDEDAVSRYWGKVQVEARWYFLQSALFNARGRADEIRLKGELQRLQHERGRTSPGLYANRERLRMSSDSVLAAVMLHRVDNLKLLEDAYLYLLDNENIASDNLLRILDDRAEAERRLATITTAPTRAVSLQSVSAGIVQVDTLAVLSSLSVNDIDFAILDMKSALIDVQAGNTSWWSDVRVAPFVRYSHYFRQEVPGSSNVDVGVSFTVPINSEASRQRKSLQREKSLIECERRDKVAAAADKIRYLALEIERLNRSIEGEWGRANSLRRYLSMRHDAYVRRQGEYNRLSAMMEYNAYLRCLENIVETQFRRDSYLADMQALVPNVALQEYCVWRGLGAGNAAAE